MQKKIYTFQCVYAERKPLIEKQVKDKDNAAFRGNVPTQKSVAEKDTDSNINGFEQ